MKKRKQFAGCRIVYRVYSMDLFEGWGDCDRYSEKRSGERYGSILHNRLRRALPGADVEVDVRHHVGGAGGGASVDCQDYRLENDMKEIARDAAGRLYESHRSWVRLARGDA